MAAQQILFDVAARHKTLRGVELLARPVKLTLGPRGRHVVIDQAFGPPSVTKDGADVAKEIELPDPFENMGAQMVKEVAARTARDAGDGTTTATVLAEAIFKEGLRHVAAGCNPIHLKRGIDKAVTAALAALAKQSRPVDGRNTILRVATVSANGDASIGTLIADAMDRVGKDGVISVEEGKAMESSLTVVDGMQVDQGYLSGYFATVPETMEAVLADAYVLIHEKKIVSLNDLLPLLQAVAKTGKPLLIVAEAIAREALSTLVMNQLRNTLRVCAVKAPGFGEQRAAQMVDLGLVCGCRPFAVEWGERLDELSLDALGRARLVTVGRTRTLVLGGGGSASAVGQRAKQLRHQIEDTTSDDDRATLQQRLARLVGGVAVISVGASTEFEMKEKKARVDDALHATRAAVSEGVVAGGGVALVRCRAAVDALVLSGDEAMGARIVHHALAAPLGVICANAGGEPGVILHHVASRRGGFGYNVVTERYEDLFAAGIIDPTKVTRVALQNAASIAGLLLTTDCMLAEIPAAGPVAVS